MKDMVNNTDDIFNEEEQIEKPKIKKPFGKKHWQIFTVVLGILFVISILTSGFHFGTSAAITSDAVKSTLEELSGASVVSVDKENGLYKANVKDEQGNEGVIYMSSDGNLLFQGAIQVDKLREYISSVKGATGNAVQETKKMNCSDITKQDKPLLESFVVSNCPYGVQMQQILFDVAKLFKDNIKVRYIGSIENNKITSMHGDAEATENLRQICIREEQADKYWDYVKCYTNKKDEKACLTEAKVDEAKLQTCMTDTSKGIKYAEEDFKLQDKYQVTGSPTLFLNGIKVSEFDFGGRNADAVKTMLCCGFKTTPSDCAKKLETTGTATQGNC